jgi:hypothetical protein
MLHFEGKKGLIKPERGLIGHLFITIAGGYLGPTPINLILKAKKPSWHKQLTHYPHKIAKNQFSLRGYIERYFSCFFQNSENFSKIQIP